MLTLHNDADTLLANDQLRIEREEGVAVIVLDQQGAAVNKISEATLDALDAAFDYVEHEASLKAVVLISGKAGSFVAGADLDMLGRFRMPAEVRALSHRAHDLLQRVRRMEAPTVAAIHGAAMGGGLELTLGCTVRIASTGDATRLALPEVKLGLLPGGGGTQLLPRLVGVQQALGMMLTGKNVYPRKARRIGLVDALVHPPGLRRAALDAARDLAAGRAAPNGKAQPLAERLLESTALSRRLVYQQAAARARKQTRGNYPAPPRIIDCVRVGLEQGLEAGFETEAKHFGALVFTPESRALVSLFFAKQKGDKNPLAEHVQSVDTVGVLGAGLMGAGIGEVSAENGLNVVLKDQSFDLAAQGKRHVWRAMSKKAERRIVSAFERDQVVERVWPTGDYDAFRGADLVIEAVPERLDLKRQVLADVEAVIADDAVFATNTSSIPVAEIAAEAARPERVLGMHYFSPVAKMPLLEIITTEHTSDAALATALDVGHRQGKTVIVVGDGPGFYTTRILALFMNEALLMLDEGADAEQMETAMKDFGFPMGPCALFDLVGIDVAAKITEVMQRYMTGDRLTISDAAARMAEAGIYGQKNGVGFYHYAEDATRPERGDFNAGVYRFFGGATRTTLDPAAIQERLALTMVNEAVRCLEEGILHGPVDGDLGAVFGLGFPPFRGGPFRYADAETAPALAKRLRRLADAHGPRFTPAAVLQQHAEAGTRFHEAG